MTSTPPARPSRVRRLAPGALPAERPAVGAALAARVAAALAVVAALPALACSSAAAPAGTSGAAGYASMCASCHGEDGHPPGAMVARLGVRDLADPQFRARATPALIEQQIRTGSKSKLMPSFEGAIDDAQIKAIAAYVASPQFGARR